VQVSYYPGCSLDGIAAEYDQSVRAVCEAVGVELVELVDWNCCGASSAHYVDDELAVRLPARNVLIAERSGRDVLVPCTACFQRLKHAQKALSEGTARRTDEPYEGRTAIYHVNEFFENARLLDRVAEKVVRPLRALAAVPYYGCLSQRPPKVTGAAAPENPVSMDRLMEAIGIEPVPWSYKTDCCGGSLAVSRTDLVRNLSGDLFEAAREAGAECLVTDCPMCQSNLDGRQAEIEVERGTPFNLPVFYITELMALAFGDRRTAGWWKKHFVDPRPLLQRKRLM